MTSRTQGETKQAAAESSRRGDVRELVPLLVVGAVFAILCARLCKLASHYAVNILFSDQWDFDSATLFEKHSLWQMFSWQHGPHRQGLGAIISWLVEPSFRWNSRAEAYLIIGIVALAALCALYLKTRLYGPITFSDVIIPLIFFTPIQYETIWVTANLAHGPMPLLLVILYCLSWTLPNLLARYSLVLIFNFLAIYTGFGLFLGVITPLLLAIDYYANRGEPEIRKSLFVAAEVLSLTSLGSFFIRYTFAPAADCFSLQPQSPIVYASFVAAMLAHFFGGEGAGRVGIGLGSIVMAWMLAAVAVTLRDVLSSRHSAKLESGRQSIISIGLIGYCLFFSANTAYGRACLGIDQARASRYSIYLALGALGMYLYSLSLRRRRIRNISVVILLAMSAAGSIHINSHDRGGMEYLHDFKVAWRNCYLAGGEIERCDQLAGFPIYPGPPERTHLKEKLEYLKHTKQNLYSDFGPDE